MNLPEIPRHKLPHFVNDIVEELRDRHLLPVVAVIAVAIVAVPVLLSSSSESSAPLAPAAADVIGGEGDSSSISVLVDDPGLRKYKERLDRLSPKNPFKQQYTRSVTEAGKLGESLSTAVDGGDGEGSVGFGSLTGDGDVPESDSGSGGQKAPDSTDTSKPQTLSYEIDVLAGAAGTEIKRRNGVKVLTPLPGPRKPVVVFLDVTPNGRNALFMVSSQATLLEGGSCIREEGLACQIMSLQPKLTATLTYAVNGKTYFLRVQRIARIVK